MRRDRSGLGGINEILAWNVRIDVILPALDLLSSLLAARIMHRESRWMVPHLR
jgi:hypothetical protein